MSVQLQSVSSRSRSPSVFTRSSTTTSTSSRWRRRRRSSRRHFSPPGRPSAIARSRAIVTAGAVVGALAAVWVLAAPELSAGPSTGLPAVRRRRSLSRSVVGQAGSEPQSALARAALRTGDHRVELRETTSPRSGSTSRRPGSSRRTPTTWCELGLFRQIALENQCSAYFALNAAYTLDPKSARFTPTGPLAIAAARGQRSGESRLRAVTRGPGQRLKRSPEQERLRRVRRYAPTTTTALAPWSCEVRSPSSGPTMPMPRSRASLRPSPSKPRRYMTRLRVKSDRGAFATPPIL